VSGVEANAKLLAVSKESNSTTDNNKKLNNGTVELLNLTSMPRPVPNMIERTIFKGRSDLHFLLQFGLIEPYLQYADQYGDLVNYQLTRGGEFVLVSTAEDLERVYSSEDYFARPSLPYFGYTFARLAGIKNDSVLLESVSNSKGETWNRIRGVVDAVLSERMPLLIPEFNAAARWLVAEIDKNLDAQYYVPYNDIYRMQIRLLGQQAYGAEEFTDEIAALFESVVTKWFDYLYRFVFFQYQHGKGWPRGASVLKWFLEPELDSVAEFQKGVLKKVKDQSSSSWMGLLSNRRDDNGSLILTDEEVMAITFDVFILGAIGSGTTAMEYSFYLLGSHPDIQSRLAATLLEKDEVTLEHLTKNSFLHDVAQEVLRQYPPGGGINGRATTKDTSVNVYKLPNNTNVIINALRIHHDKRYWKEPSRFYPDRFRAPNNEPKHPSAFTPFGAGKRRCPGYDHGWVQLNIFLAHIYREFEVVYPHQDPPEMIFKLVARPKERFSVLFKRRPSASRVVNPV